MPAYVQNLMSTINSKDVETRMTKTSDMKMRYNILS